jgi:hypothetical protein
MSYVILALIFVALSFVAPSVASKIYGRFERGGHPPPPPFALLLSLRVVFGLFALSVALATSVVTVPGDKVGIVKRLYGSKNLPDGHLIATSGETGYQADIIPPGTWAIWPLFNAFNSVEEKPLVVVPNGVYGRIVARDGANIDDGEIMAKAWPEAEYTQRLNAQFFLTHGGQKGLQLSVLKPGTYAINLAQFEIRIGYKPNGRDITISHDDLYNMDGLTNVSSPLDTSITRVPAGSVGVVRSSVQEKGKDCTAYIAKTDKDGLAAELVAEGCKGVWSASLPPNDYYLNRDAFDVTLVSTRVTTLEFKGGYERRYIDLKIDSKGDFQQTERSVHVAPSGDDAAVGTKVEGWEIPQELRVVVQISPENAPIVVAAVGGQKEVDDRILVPSIRSNVRNVFGGNIPIPVVKEDGAKELVTRPTRVLDTIENRPALEEAILSLVREDARRAGVGTKEVRLGESVIPPELLLARQRQQLATQLTSAFIQERTAQEQRQLTEQARATADQQSTIVTAEIGVKTAKLLQDRRQAEGHAERLYLEEQAAGQTAQANVLGKDSVMKLQMFNRFVELLQSRPEIVTNIKLPTTFVSGGGLFDGAAAIFGADVAAAAKPQQPASNGH